MSIILIKPLSRMLLCAFTVALLGALGLGHAQAAGSGIVRTDQTELRLISASDAVGDGKTLTVGLQFRLKPHWKTYWRSPGDAGFPMVLDWSGSENVDKAEMQWPRPIRFSVLGLTTIGYTDEVVFPIALTVKDPGKPVSLKLKASYLTCEEICIPYSADLALDLPAGPAMASNEAPMIAKFVDRLPVDFDRADVVVERSGLSASAKGPVLELVLRSATPFASPDVFVEGDTVIVADPPLVSLEDAGHVARLISPLGTERPDAASLVGKKLAITVLDGERLIQTTIEPPLLASSAGDLSLLAVLAIALLGGLILNLMPCVLPVLSIKLLSVIGQGGRAPAAVRVSFLATTAGIVAAFAVLAGIAIGLRQAGIAVAQGMQFQQPIFLLAMMAILVAFAVNMAGRYEIALPGRLQNAVANIGPRHGHAGAFWTGALATLLATPCSAPYVGTALGYALSRGPMEIGLIFLALALGLALPYLLVAAFPKLATRLPRPGRWMIVLRQILAVSLIGTAIWLGLVLLAIAGSAATIAAAVALAALALLLWFGRDIGRLAAPLAIVAALAAILAPVVLAQAPRPTAPSAASWRNFDEAQIAELVGQGKAVFVDVTADWCLTCQVNKKLVLDDKTIAARLDGQKVIAMRADWTRPSDRITLYLKRFGRYGIPFNVVYGPGAPQGIVLPELLSIEAMNEALDRAGASAAAARR